MEPILHGGKTHLAHSTVAAVIDVRGPSWSARSCDESRTCSESGICKGQSDHLPGYCVVSALISIELDEYSAHSAPKVTPFVFALLTALAVRSPQKKKSRTTVQSLTRTSCTNTGFANMCTPQQEQHCCVICFGECKENEVDLKCGHGNIHADCLASWLAEQRRRKVQESCPVCRARIDADFVTIVSVSGMTDGDTKEKYIIIERGDISYYR